MDIRLITLGAYQAAIALYEELKIDFPKCFFPLGKERPLKVGIYQDLVKLKGYNVPERKQVLKSLLMLYTSSIFYRAALLMPEAIRIDLNGHEVDKVSPKSRYIAKTHCRHIIWELEKKGYEHQKMLAQKYKKLGENTPEVMARLFPPTPKKEKPKKTPALKSPKQATPPKPKKEPSPIPQRVEIAKPLAPAQLKKPVTVIVKKKKILQGE